MAAPIALLPFQALSRVPRRPGIHAKVLGTGAQVFRNPCPSGPIAMEMVEARTLAAWLAAATRSWREIAAIFIEAGNGLAAAHRGGMVHSDFKPENVLCGADGRVRVTDFGLVRGSLDGPVLCGIITVVEVTIHLGGAARDHR